jgi:tetratricopeptide (TPR) repeat protein
MKRYLGLITLATLCTLIMQSSSLANNTTSTSFREVNATTGKLALLKKKKVEKTFILGTESGGEVEGYYCESLAKCNRDIKLDPKSSGRYIIRAEFKANELQDYRGAMADYDRAIQMSPKFSGHYHKRAIFKADKLHDYTGAMADYDRAIQVDPNNWHSYMDRASFKVRTIKDYRGGDADCSLALKYASKSIDVHNIHVMCHWLLGTKKWILPSSR